MAHSLYIIPALFLYLMVVTTGGALYAFPKGDANMISQLENGIEEQIEQSIEKKERLRRQKEEEERRKEEEKTRKETKPEVSEEPLQEDSGENGFGDFGEADDSFGDFGEAKERGLLFSGLLRNDAYIADPPDLHPRTDPLFHDILEMRLIAEARNENWKFYSDVRAFYYNGEIATLMGTNYDIRWLRAFVRFNSKKHEFSVGKTYINFGNPGLFNPFELDKSVQMTDLQYARDGHLAAEYILHWQDTASLKVFGGVPAGPFDYNFTWGVSPSVHLGDFNLGAVLLHRKADFNTLGLYFKGDLYVGIEGAAAVHLDDNAKMNYTEANLGIDYSFTEDFIATVMFYYNENGADDPANYLPSADQFLLARYYLFTSLNYSVDEFLGFQFGAFYNLVDESLIVLPAMNLIITNSLSTTFQMIVPTGGKNSEFSKNTTGEWTALLRIESKF